MKSKILVGFVISMTLCVAVFPQSSPKSSAEPSAYLSDFQVVEFRRYSIKPGGRQNFAKYFESFFPEAMEQTGAIAAGTFFERNNPNGFTWIRAFHTIEARAINNAQFYYGPVWKEHKNTMNELMTDSDNVLLLRPLIPERSLTILPPVDPITEAAGAQGVIVALIFAIKANSVDAFAKLAEPEFSSFQKSGARAAGVLVTLDTINNFPQLPVRTDGPFLVWLGILKDNQTLEKQFMPVVESSIKTLFGSDLVRSKPEVVVLDPTPRSRMRWVAQ
jgi:hypothetical protein